MSIFAIGKRTIAFLYPDIIGVYYCKKAIFKINVK